MRLRLPMAGGEEERRLDRMRACLAGGALGDARVSVRLQARADEDRAAAATRLTVSADTQLTMFTLEGLLCGLDTGQRTIAGLLESLRQAYLRWLATQRTADGEELPPGLGSELVLRVRRNPGRTCLTALALGACGTIDQPVNDSKGCGAVARSAPIGFLGRQLGPRGVFELAARAAALTHGHPCAYLSAAAIALIVHYLLEDRPIATAAERAVDELARWPRHEETVSALLAAINEWDSKRQDHAGAVRRLGRGRLAEDALAIGLYLALVGGELDGCLSIAQSLDLEYESPVVIAGQIAGARRGTASLPRAEVARLEVSAILDAVAARLPAFLATGV